MNVDRITAVRERPLGLRLGLWIALLVLGACSLGVKPAWRALDDEVRVQERWLRRDGRDPWGHPFGVIVLRSRTLAPWKANFPLSLGPNGRDERGQGDDVVVRFRWKYGLYDHSPWLVLAVGVLLGLGYLLNARLLVSADPRLQVVAAVGVALLVASGITVLLDPYFEQAVSGRPWRMLVSPPASLFFTLLFAAALVGWVIRRRSAQPGDYGA